MAFLWFEKVAIRLAKVAVGLLANASNLNKYQELGLFQPKETRPLINKLPHDRKLEQAKITHVFYPPYTSTKLLSVLLSLFLSHGEEEQTTLNYQIISLVVNFEENMFNCIRSYESGILRRPSQSNATHPFFGSVCNSFVRLGHHNG